jgi:serine/threonine protein kinase
MSCPAILTITPRSATELTTEPRDNPDLNLPSTLTLYRIGLPGSTGTYYIDQPNLHSDRPKYFLKKFRPKIDAIYNVRQREAFILKRLQTYPYFPRVLEVGSDYLLFNYIGPHITLDNMPSDTQPQLNKILSILSQEKIIHGDIKEVNTLVGPGSGSSAGPQIYLVDFGYATWRGQASCGQGFSAKLPPSQIHNDLKTRDRELLKLMLTRLSRRVTRPRRKRKKAALTNKRHTAPQNPPVNNQGPTNKLLPLRSKPKNKFRGNPKAKPKTKKSRSTRAQPIIRSRITKSKKSG